MVLPTIPPSIPVNAVLPNLVVPRPVEQLRNNGVRPNTPQGITAADEDKAIEGQDSRRDQDRAVAERQTSRNSGFGGLGGTLDLVV
ncbi:MAG: hypothetical protein P8N43_01825 [Alphaproteobacteria bacterium]|nr:hypothetical protein [Alphaproteobacteria bacterium]